MENLLLYAYVFALLLAISGFVLRKQTQQLIWMYLFMAGAALVALGAVIFPSMNMGRNVALHKFDMLGLDISMYTAIAFTLGSGVYALARRKWWPLGLIALAGVAEVVCALLLKFYYSRL